MNNLHAWLSQQHHGLRTFQIFQQKLSTLSGDEPEQRALCRLLTYLVGSYIEAFDEEPLPVAVADRAFQRLADLVASLDFRTSAEHRLAELNRVAACDLWHWSRETARRGLSTPANCYEQIVTTPDFAEVSM
jgi:hypothetical protein